MKKLTAMTDFVLEQREHQNKIDSNVLTVIYNYAKFIKQPLELWMFVSCDEKGNVLEEPKNYVTWLGLHESKGSTIGFTEHEKYQQAKERCLFEGFEVGRYSGSKDNHFDYIDNSNYQFRLWTKDVGSNVWKSCDNKFKTVEDLVKYNIQLTQTAIKQIGL